MGCGAVVQGMTPAVWRSRAGAVSRCFPGGVLGGRRKVELTEVLQKKYASFPTQSSCSSPGLLHLSQAHEAEEGPHRGRCLSCPPGSGHTVVLWALALLINLFLFLFFISWVCLLTQKLY